MFSFNKSIDEASCEIIVKTCVKVSANNLNDDVNFKHIIEHALSCTLERVDKDVSNMGDLKFGTIDKSCLIKATNKEADCE